MRSGDMVTIAVVLGLVGLSAYFSASETAFSTLNRLRIKKLAAEGNKRAGLVRRLAGDYGTLLSTLVVGNNVVSIVATSMATVLFAEWMGDSAGPVVSAIVMTVVVLVFGEITPKTLARQAPEKFALWSAPLMRAFTVVLKPVNLLFAAWERLLGKLFKMGGSRAITEEELLIMVDEAEQEGSIEAGDKDLIRSAIEFNDRTAGEILTPRVDVAALPLSAAPERVSRLFLSTGYTRLPVYAKSIDSIIGVLHLRNWFAASRKETDNLEELLTPTEFVTLHTKISALLKLFQAQKSHMAVVTDEYGGTAGIVTLEDVLEELVGDIWDEHDEVTEQLARLGPATFRVADSANVDDVFRALGLPDGTGAVTVNGWLTQRLGRVPAVGEWLDYGGYRITVTKAGSKRVEECVFAHTAAEMDKAPRAPYNKMGKDKTGKDMK